MLNQIGRGDNKDGKGMGCVKGHLKGILLRKVMSITSRRKRDSLSFMSLLIRVYKFV